MKVEIELKDETLEELVRAELKRALDYWSKVGGDDAEDRLKDALEVALKYYGG